jgi:hypothetical protein
MSPIASVPVGGGAKEVNNMASSPAVMTTVKPVSNSATYPVYGGGDVTSSITSIPKTGTTTAKTTSTHVTAAASKVYSSLTLGLLASIVMFIL